MTATQRAEAEHHSNEAIRENQKSLVLGSDLGSDTPLGPPIQFCRVVGWRSTAASPDVEMFYDTARARWGSTLGGAGPRLPPRRRPTGAA